ncbi:299_t:CDS:10 [Entrophospora sp. SA101]|nr:299_t:CDS:10 [Entrophospora sp. SA101]
MTLKQHSETFSEKKKIVSNYQKEQITRRLSKESVYAELKGSKSGEFITGLRVDSLTIEKDQKYLHANGDQVGSNNFNLDLPEPTLENLATIHSIIKIASESSELEKYQLAKLKDVDYLHTLFNILKSIISLHEIALFEVLIRKDLFVKVAGIFEYDPQYTNKRPKHRKLLSDQSKHKQAVKIKDDLIKEKIHETFRIQFFRDSLLHGSCDDETLTALSSLICFNYIEICRHFANDSEYLLEIFDILNKPNEPIQKKYDSIGFLQELFHIAKNLQPSSRSDLYRALCKNGILDAIESTLEIDDPILKSGGSNLLSSIMVLEAGIVRLHILRKHRINEKSLATIIINQIVENKNSDFTTHLAGVLQSLININGSLDMDYIYEESALARYKEEKDNDQFLQFFYENLSVTLFGPLINLPNLNSETEILYLTESQLTLFFHLCELMRMMIRYHGVRSKFLIMTNSIVPKLVLLLRTNDKILRLSALRTIRSIIGLDYKFVAKNVASHKIMTPILKLLLEPKPKNSLLNSASVELLEYIRVSNIRPFIDEIVDKHREELSSTSDYANTFEKLIQQYDRNHNQTTDVTTESDEATNNPANPRQAIISDWSSTTRKSSSTPSPTSPTDQDQEEEEINIDKELNKWKKYPAIYNYSFDVTEITKPPRKPASKKVSKKVYDRIRSIELLGRNIVSVYDGGPIFSNKKFAFDHKEDKEFKIDLPAEVEGRRSKNYQVKLRYQGEADLEKLMDFVSLNPNTEYDGTVQFGLSLLNAILNSTPRLNHLSLGRRSIFPDLPLFKEIKLPGALVLKPGIQQALKPGWDCLVVNVDRSSAIFYPPGPLINIIPEAIQRGSRHLRTLNDLKTRGLSLDECRSLQSYLKDVKLEITSYGKRRQITISRLSHESAANLKVNKNDRNSQTIQQYFKSRWDYELQYPKLPCIGVYNRNLKKDDYYPIEVCEIVKDQKFEEKEWKPLSEDTRRQVVRKTCIEPKDRFDYIYDAIHEVYKYDEDKVLKAFGLKIDSHFIEEEGKIVPEPNLHTGSNLKTVIRNHRWDTDKFVEAKAVVNWSVIIFDSYVKVETIEAAMRLLRSTLTKRGMSVPYSPSVKHENPQGDIQGAVVKALERARFDKKRGNADLIICIVTKNGGNSTVYPAVKKIAATLGVATQCILSNNIDPRHKDKWGSTFNNLSLKINGKLGGENARLSPGELEKITKKEHFMVMGADVFHPGRLEGERASIAGVIASKNLHLTKYAARFSANRKVRNETIEDLEPMSVELLEVYYSENKRLPDQIVFYRDGVSDTGFQNVKDQEITALKAAFKTVYSKHKQNLPKLTFVIVQKRHRARALALNSSNKNQNCEQGTVIFTGIVVPQNFEFYLYSHTGRLGTSKPTHYYVIYDERGFSNEEMFEFTYKLCFFNGFIKSDCISVAASLKDTEYYI